MIGRCRQLHVTHGIRRHQSVCRVVTTLLLAGLLLCCDVASAAEKENDLLFGMSTALSGPAAELGINMRAGVLAEFYRINQQGGIQGRKVRLVSLDDGYEPAQTSPNMRRLIEDEKVLAVIGNVGTPTAIAAIPIANEERTLLFAPFTGAGVLRKSPPDRYVINYRASYAEETGAMIDALINIGQIRPREIAFFTQRDGYGDAGFIGGLTALKRHGLNKEHHIKHVRYERNTLAVENALASLLLVEPPPRAIVMVGAYGPCAKFIKLASDAGLDPVFLNVSFVGSAPLARELEGRDAKVIVTQVVPHPLKSNVPLVKDYRKDLKTFDPSSTPNFGSLEGYIATRVLIRALQNIEGGIGRETVIDSLEGLETFDIGLGHKLQLNQTSHQASHQVWPTILQDGTFVPFNWEHISTVVSRSRGQ